MAVGRHGEHRSVPKFLASLGIEFRKKNRESFWLTNEAELEYIYADFMRAARKVKARLHPDAGGNDEEFIAFTRQVENVQKAFRKHGIDRQLPLLKPKRVKRKRSELSAAELERVRKMGRARWKKMAGERLTTPARLHVPQTGFQSRTSASRNARKILLT